MKKEDIFHDILLKIQLPFYRFYFKSFKSDDSILDLGGGEGAYSEELIKGYNIICADNKTM